ncbi:hypothetical protein PROH_20360 [Prochlorothrix hollandica PCC 9006 = CALU 1027]|uniref:Alpha-amylase n=1 Tax=Prochlorothrix hollandica PCC 9006 = CALU 1027 TaxID=317619 RepID=A0A0M2PNS1_PROHO|nr:hypothetical protein PROH_20360 [Prochlorothrix hollandica PCC 9006 = CALU 1027]
MRSLKQLFPLAKNAPAPGIATTPPAPPRHPQSWFGGYQPDYLTHISQVYSDGSVDIAVRVYWPRLSGKGIGDPTQIQDSGVQVRVEDGPWQDLTAPHAEYKCWSAQLDRVLEGSAIHFRYRDGQGVWQAFAPLTDLETLYGTTYVPSLTYEWEHQAPRYDHAKVLLETTLEGLLAGYKGGKFAGRDLDELSQVSIADRMIATDIPGQLAAWNIDEVMVPVCASVANRSHLDPKFNYLTYNFIEIDWQVGGIAAFKRLVDRFYGYQIQLIPDLIFAHQVRNPFAGSLDQIQDPHSGMAVFVDPDPFLFRDYGTWMLNLAEPHFRQLLAEKMVTFAQKYHLKVLRIDYVDGLILQYSNRNQNYAEEFIRELKAALRQHCPDVVTLGETFEVAGNPAVQDFIDVFYAPIGFTIVEELYKPPSQMERPLYPNMEVLAGHAHQVLQSKRREAYYAQLHDETWYCQHIVQGRPYVPWAYGGNPAQLAKNQGEELVAMGLLEPPQLLEFVRRTVRNAEALTMFLANLRYMFVPSVDALSLGCLDDPDQWKVAWKGVSPSQLEAWEATGLDRRDILWQHQHHRQDLVTLRGLFRRYTKVDESTYQPLVTIEMNHHDSGASLLSLFRLNPSLVEDSLLVVFNFGANVFKGEVTYEVPIPEGFDGPWAVLFDGDCPNPDLAKAASTPLARSYGTGTLLQTVQGQYSNRSAVLRLEIGARSLVVLNYRGGPAR